MATAVPAKHSKFDHVIINPGVKVIHPDPEQVRKADAKIEVDIIAVPGLGANPDWTWKSSRNRVDWIHDANMLATTIPNARIMVFEYESQWAGKGALNQRLSLVGEHLIRALFGVRSKGPKPPIVFICHSLGGLLVEQALLFAKERQNDFPNIFTSAVGSVFLGTPFRGTRVQSKASAFASVASYFGLAENSSLLKALKEDSEELRDLLHRFSLLATEAKMRLFCFFEQHESELGISLFRDMLVEESSACIDSFDRLGLPTDHKGLNKFTGPKDGGYSMVSNEINAIVQVAPGIVKSRESANRQDLIDNGTYLAILDDLSKTDPEQDMKDSVAGRPSSQASWIITNEIYEQWRNVQASQRLWIHGDPGKGQAVVAASLIYELEKHAKEADVFLAYFFCDQDERNRRKLLDVLRLLTRQIIRKRPDLAEYLLLDKGKSKKGDTKSKNWDFASISAMWTGLKSILKDSSVGTTYFIVNGIDETDPESRKDFFNLLNASLDPQLAEEMSGTGSIIKWIFLSRSQRPDLKEDLRKALVIDMDNEENANHILAAVKSHISAEVDALARQKSFSASLVYFVKKHIYSKAEGNYIYVNLMIQELKNLDATHSTISQIRKFLEDFPYGLRDMFEHIHRRVLDPKTEGIEYTKEIFRCLLLALEFPNIFELAIIADLPIEDRDNEVALRRYVSRCGAFLTISDDEDDPTVEWIDTTAKEYLEENAKKELSLDVSDVQHGIIALRCFDHVCATAAKLSKQQQGSDTIERNEDQGQVTPVQDGSEPRETGEHRNEDSAVANDAVNPMQSEESVSQDGQSQGDQDAAASGGTGEATPHGSEVPSEKGQDVEEESEEDEEELLYYPSEYWLDHAKLAPPDLVTEFNLQHEFWAKNSESRAFWWQEFAANEYENLADFTSLHVAAFSGCLPLVDHLLTNEHGDEVENTDTWGRTPFFWACTDGNMDLVRRLIEAGADANTSGALCTAISEEHAEIIKYLLELQVPIDVQDDEFGPPLYAAAEIGNTDIVTQLLQAGADVNFTGGPHRRALNIAAYFGHNEIVHRLFDKAVEIDPDDSYFLGSALGAAARHGHADVVRFLLDKGWNVNRKFKINDSALVLAATYGHADAVRTLLTRSVDVIARQKALEVASEKGKADVVEQLLTEMAGVQHQEAFRLAAYYGRNDILKLLGNLGTTQEMLDTSLYHAADQERQTTVEFLLDFGANPNAGGEEYGTALIAAAYDGTEEIVKLLLERHADVNSQQEKYGTALQVAASFGNLLIAQMLLDRGAHVNTEPIGKYGSPLQAACFSGNKDLVEPLLECGANVNAQGGEYGCPVIAAAEEGRGEIFEILLNQGADINANFDDTPLIVYAAFSLTKEYLEMLLDRGVSIESMSRRGTNVLIAAAAACDPEGVTMLLERGANVHAWGEKRGTALHAAASEGDEECCEILLQHGAEFNSQCGPWNTALQAAAVSADLPTIELLLKAGADVNLSGGEFGCALQAAAKSGDVECLQVLMKAGAEVNLAGGKYGTALQAAAYAGEHECLLALRDAGADVHYAGGKYGCAMQAAACKGRLDCVKTLLDAGADVNQEGGKYHTVLQAAVFANNLEIVTKLVEHQANAPAAGGIYGSALNVAASKGRTEIMSLLLDKSLPEQTLDSGLLQAVYHRQVEAVEMLLKNGASVQATNPELGSALDALEKEVPDDTNSDDMGDWDDEESEEDSASEDEGDDEDKDQEAGDEPEDEADQDSDDEGLEANFADLHLEDCSPEEKIRKILEEAMAKIRRNPSIKRFRTIKHQASRESMNNQAPEVVNESDSFTYNGGNAAMGNIVSPFEYPTSYGTGLPSQTTSSNYVPGPGINAFQPLAQASGTGPAISNNTNATIPLMSSAGLYQTSSDSWRRGSNPQNSFADQYPANQQPPNNVYAAYNDRPVPQPPPPLPARPSPQASPTPQYPSTLMAASPPSRPEYHAYGSSQPLQAHTPSQYSQPSVPPQNAYTSYHRPQPSYTPPNYPYPSTTAPSPPVPGNNGYTNLPSSLYPGQSASPANAASQASPGRPTAGAGEDVDLKERAQGWMKKAKNYRNFLQ